MPHEEFFHLIAFLVCDLDHELRPIFGNVYIRKATLLSANTLVKADNTLRTFLFIKVPLNAKTVRILFSQYTQIMLIIHFKLTTIVYQIESMA
jgi:hypothetical protein